MEVWEVSYLAVIIDGEGSITLTRMHENKIRRHCISIASTDKELKDHHVFQSMSRQATCLDNAAMESFFHLLKTRKRGLILHAKPPLLCRLLLMILINNSNMFWTMLDFLCNLVRTKTKKLP